MSRAAAFATLAIIGLASLAACATGADRGPVFEVVQERAQIDDRSLIRRIGILDDDMLLIEVGASELYRVKLFPGCVDFADVFSGVRLDETGIGVDRGTRFIVDGQYCPVRSIEQVRRIRPQAAAQAAAEPAESDAAPSPETAAEDAAPAL